MCYWNLFFTHTKLLMTDPDSWEELFFSPAAFATTGNLLLMKDTFSLKVKPVTYSYEDNLLHYLMKDDVYIWNVFIQYKKRHIKTTIATHLGGGGAQFEFDMWEWLKFFFFCFFFTNSKHCFLPLSAPVPGTGAKVFPVWLKMEWINTEEDESPFLNSSKPPPKENKNKQKAIKQGSF